RESLLVEPAGRLVVVLPVGKPARAVERLEPARRRRLAGRTGEQVAADREAFAQVAALMPEAPQPAGGEQADLDSICLQRPAKPGSDVVVLELDPIEPFATVDADELGLCR